MNRRLAWALLLGMTAALSLGIVWNAGWEARPGGGDQAADIDLFINEFKREVADRDQVEHIFGPSSSDDNGLHRMGSARAFVSNAEPGAIDGPGQYNSTAGVVAGTLLITDEVGPTTRDLGAGRFWVDLDGLGATAEDDRQLNVWSETANGFRAVRTELVGGMPVNHNLIYNGSFEITDGSGALASITIPSRWVVQAPNPTFTYQDPTGVSEGEGLALNTTGTGGQGGITQTLAGLKANTAYVVRVRAISIGAADLCNLHVSDGTTDTRDVSLAGPQTAYETLEVRITTTAVPAPVEVELETEAAGDVCRWDEVTVFEQFPQVAQPGIQVCRVADTSTGANYYTYGAWATVGTTCAVTPPGPGYIVKATGLVNCDDDNLVSGTNLLVRMQENGATVDVASTSIQESTTASVMVGFTRVNPTPGATLTYTLDGRVNSPAGANCDRNMDDAAETHGETVASWILVELIPTR